MPYSAPSPSPSPPPQPPTPPPQATTAAGRPIRVKRKTWKLLEQLPEPPVALAPAPAELVPESEPQPPQSTWVWRALRTTANTFGLFREYPSIPTHNPDDSLGLADLSDIPAAAPVAPQQSPAENTPFVPADETSFPDAPSDTGPFRNTTTLGLMKWMWSGSKDKSIDEVDRLVDFLKSDEFKKEDVADFDLKRETAAFDAFLASPRGNIRDGWKQASVDISVPDGKHHDSEAEAPVFTVPGLHYRPIVEVIKAAQKNNSRSRWFHFTLFKQFWVPSPGALPQRIFDEIYSSDAMVEAHTELQKQPPEPGCTLERVVLSLMWWSDSTHLASFGNASLWPLYLFFGNQSKWFRVKPRSNLCHHVVYFPKVSRLYVRTNEF
ncbi:hypothetical protein B0H16DRAFT_1345295 [Mycena metata]|uniref:Uncharacterized protein n=1 Tax=Mycena metata TaxID=1033252 RepID=A0AAD7GX61_9AGAR|nr:hypothetical protein B0H16DRAFT_1345295 [Mycena metata]